MLESPLTDVECRILGCLMEKQHTTPDYYPLTLNALVAACNQTSNRHLLAGPIEVEVVAAALEEEKVKSPPALAQLEAEVQCLRAELAELREAFEAFKAPPSIGRRR